MKSKYFNDDEFKCKCGCGMDVNDDHKALIFKMRELAGVPFVITSGARCEAHNAAVGGRPNSEHTCGHGSDIAYTSSAQAYAIEKAAYACGVKRIGRNRKKKFFHIGTSTHLPQNVSFDY